MFKDLGEVESEREAFRAREREKTAAMGALSGLTHGELFRRISEI